MYLQKNENAEAWFVLLSVVAFNIIMGYHNLSFGIYYVTFTDAFQTTKASAGFINSIQGVTASMTSECTHFKYDNTNINGTQYLIWLNNNKGYIYFAIVLFSKM